MTAPKLTEAQSRVATLVLAGCTNAQIARLLGIERKTVKNHLNAIYRESGAANRHELKYACANGTLGQPQSAGF